MIFAGKFSGRFGLDIMFGAGGAFGVLLVRAVFGIAFLITAVGLDVAGVTGVYLFAVLLLLIISGGGAALGRDIASARGLQFTFHAGVGSGAGGLVVIVFGRGIAGALDIAV